MYDAPEKESVRSVSFTDFNGNSVTVTLCQMCLAELKMKAATEYRSMTEERAKLNRFKIGDHVYLEHLGVVSEIKTWKALKWQTGQTQTESGRLPLRKSQNIKNRGSDDGEKTTQSIIYQLCYLWERGPDVYGCATYTAGASTVERRRIQTKNVN